MQKVLVSACLLGADVRYHGGNASIDHPVLRQWAGEERLVSACPEAAGGLSTPRPPAEIRRPAGPASVPLIVVTREGKDVSAACMAGARSVLELVRHHDIRVAILKDGSPSCGSTTIHDGTFSGARVPGEGVTASMLRAAGVQVFEENRIDEAAACVAALEEEAASTRTRRSGGPGGS